MRRFFFTVLLVVTSCSREPDTPIIQRVEQDGAGDVRVASADAIHKWMQAKGSTYAREIWAMCEPVKKAAAATWGDSTEGRICAAADKVRFFARVPLGSDPRKY